MKVTTALAFACAALTVAFVATAPWKIGAVTVDRLEAVLAIWVIPIAVTLLRPSSRRLLFEALGRPFSLHRHIVIGAVVIVFAFLLRAMSAKFLALEVSAWDFSLSFDRPIERTLHGDLLWSDDLGHSMLGVHANWLLLAFVPLYAITASPWWLVIGQAAAFTAATALLFFAVRAMTGDDCLSGAVALAFLLNRYTAHAAQALFTADVFYPAALFLLFYAFVRERPRLFAVALALTVSIKEDAILPLAGFALVAWIGYRRGRWALAAFVAGVAVFLADYFVVLPAFAFWVGPAYSGNWSSYGPTPLAALLGMIRHPLLVTSRVFTGAFDLFATLAFVPMAGWPWILAALPSLVILGAADSDQVHFFSLHYSLTVLPGLFMSVPLAAERIARRFNNPLAVRRFAGIAVLVVSALVGSTYRFERPRIERRFVKIAVREAGARRIFVQGSLLPHAGYATNVRVLHHRIVPPPVSAFLLCATCSPYPFSREEIAARIRAMEMSGTYDAIRHGDLILFRPR